MKSSLFAVLVLYTISAASAQMRKFFEIYPGEKVLDILSPAAVYANDQFMIGTVRYPNGKSVEHKLNHYLLFDEMHYLKGNDTLVLDAASVDFVTIGRDTFKRDLFYYQTLKDYSKIKLVRRKTAAFIRRERSTVDSIPFVDSYQLVNNFWFPKNMVAGDTLRLGLFDMYYITDEKNKVQTVHRENLFKIYPQRKEALQNYLSGRTVWFSNRREVEAMLDFVTK